MEDYAPITESLYLMKMASAQVMIFPRPEIAFTGFRIPGLESLTFLGTPPTTDQASGRGSVVGIMESTRPIGSTGDSEAWMDGKANYVRIFGVFLQCLLEGGSLG